MRNDYFIKSETDLFVFSASVDSVMVNSSLPLTNQHFYRHPIPIPEFQGNKKENKGNQNQTTDVKEPILILQEISSWIIIRKGERHDKTDQPTKERIVNGNRVLGKVIKHIENVNHGT